MLNPRIKLINRIFEFIDSVSRPINLARIEPFDRQARSPPETSAPKYMHSRPNEEFPLEKPTRGHKTPY